MKKSKQLSLGKISSTTVTAYKRPTGKETGNEEIVKKPRAGI